MDFSRSGRKRSEGYLRSHDPFLLLAAPAISFTPKALPELAARLRGGQSVEGLLAPR